jgi:hypothetical protein
LLYTVGTPSPVLPMFFLLLFWESITYRHISGMVEISPRVFNIFYFPTFFGFFHICIVVCRLVATQRPRNKRDKQPLLGNHQRASGLAE